jgi:hypothetical protein
MARGEKMRPCNLVYLIFKLKTFSDGPFSARIEAPRAWRFHASAKWAGLRWVLFT